MDQAKQLMAAHRNSFPKTLALLVLGAVFWIPLKFSLEQRLSHTLKNQSIDTTVASMPLLRDLGHSAVLAILSGMKSLVANFTWLDVTAAWEKQDWFTLRQKASVATFLEPRFEMFWEMSAWHLAWNAALDAERKAVETDNPRAQTIARYWIREGESFLKRGIVLNPQSHRLYYALASLQQYRLGDYASAAESYLLASQQPGALPFLERFAGYMMEESGQYARAYEHYCNIWQRAQSRGESRRHWDKIEQRIRHLEAVLKIPSEERFSNRFTSATEGTLHEQNPHH
jgi:tetratricopeptide (TPR) repeat protein